MGNRYRFSLRLKLVVFTTFLALITYSTSAFFIYVVYDYVQSRINISQQVFVISTLLAGVVWSGILAFLLQDGLQSLCRNWRKLQGKQPKEI